MILKNIYKNKRTCSVVKLAIASCAVLIANSCMDGDMNVDLITGRAVIVLVQTNERRDESIN